MIDFRYHLVSLASVLIALAIGIVLGAGPLKEDIGNTLASEVTDLRQEKDELRAELDRAHSEIETREQFESSVVDDVVDGRLSGISVALVTLPGAESDLTAAAEETLTAAGAEVVGSVTLTEEWLSEDAELANEHEDLADDLAEQFAVEPLDVPGARTVDAVLATVLLGSEPLKGQPEAGARAEALDRLAGAGLVEGTLTSRAATVVIVAPPAAEEGEGAPEEVLAGLATLGEVLDRAASAGVMIAGGPVPDGTAVESVLDVVRSREDSGLSTVDGARSGMGRVNIVLALVEQLAGDTGDYGRQPELPAFPGADS